MKIKTILKSNLAMEEVSEIQHKKKCIYIHILQSQESSK